MFTEFLLHARCCARGFRYIISGNPQNIPDGGHHFTTGHMEQLRLTEVKGTALGCPASPWYLDDQNFAGSRAPVVPKISQKGAKPQAATESGGGY